ncbi:MAG: FAD-dependent oxidoreductase, partial [Candidatus Marinimicrobia bacterium]|nr:FAD-dependent oxidoreductase [Candidatus Neomarinimicrobiota bacterium]
MNTDVLIIGGGMAGCVAALSAAETGSDVTLGTKTDELVGGNTNLAQGGIIFKGANDSPELLKKDILAAGAGFCYEPAVDELCNHGPGLVEELLIKRLKVPFTHSDTGNEYHRTAEAAHSVPRILHANDQTGAAIEAALVRAVEEQPKIRVLKKLTALELLTNTHHSADPAGIYQQPRC